MFLEVPLALRSEQPSLWGAGGAAAKVPGGVAGLVKASLSSGPPAASTPSQEAPSRSCTVWENPVVRGAAKEWFSRSLHKKA